MSTETISGTFSAWLKTAKDKFDTTFITADFGAAVMAACALVACADKNLEPAERRRVADAIRNNEILSKFKFDDLKVQFDDSCDRLLKDFDMNSVDVMAKIGKLRKNEEQARQALRIGILVAKSSDGISDVEKDILKEICKELKLDPADFIPA